VLSQRGSDLTTEDQRLQFCILTVILNSYVLNLTNTNLYKVIKYLFNYIYIVIQLYIKKKMFLKFNIINNFGLQRDDLVG
jgi:hypothetical protein